jgi:hypothetical protein
LPEATIQAVNDRFQEYAAALAEKPNSVLDILTATACYQARILIDKSQYDPIGQTEKNAQLPTIYIRDFLCGPDQGRDFIARASDFIHAADATAIKSLEGSELARFYIGKA